MIQPLITVYQKDTEIFVIYPGFCFVIIRGCSYLVPVSETLFVIPAKAGIYFFTHWTPAFAGVTYDFSTFRNSNYLSYLSVLIFSTPCLIRVLKMTF